MPLIVHYNDGPRKNGHTLTLAETTEIYNALSDRINQLKAALLPELPKRVRESLEDSLETCEKLIEVFE